MPGDGRCLPRMRFGWRVVVSIPRHCNRRFGYPRVDVLLTAAHAMNAKPENELVSRYSRERSLSHTIRRLNETERKAERNPPTSDVILASRNQAFN
jgi:hypothetical protein